ncbi:hypothetical protein ES707_18262 [subsurface metagenome]
MNIDEVGDASGGLVEDAVGQLQGVGKGGIRIGDPQEGLVGDHQGGVTVLAQLLDAYLRPLGAVSSLKDEGPGNNAHGQGAQFTGNAGDARRGSGARAPAHTGGDEYHVGTRQGIFDELVVLVGSSAADVSIRSGTETLGEGLADLDFYLGQVVIQVLGIGVHGDKLHTHQIIFNHPVDGVAGGAAYSHHLYLGLHQVVVVEFEEHDQSPLIG